MQVELCDIKKPAVIASNQEATNLAKTLGLTLQASRYAKPLVKDYFTPMSADEESVWHFHAPTVYFERGESVRLLSDYAYDSIPVEVMRHWSKIKELYAFDSFEIWTTERTPHKDPLLIGVLGRAHYLLARWGEDSPEYLPLHELCRNLVDAVLRQRVKVLRGGVFDFMRDPSDVLERKKKDAWKDIEEWGNAYPKFRAAVAAQRILNGQ